MKLLSIVALMACLSTFAVSFDPCRDASRKLLSASAQKYFLAADSLPDMFGEIHSLVYRNRATVNNVEVNDILLQRNDKGRNPGVVDLFEVARTFEIQVSGLFEHVGNLESHIDVSKIAQRRPFSREQRMHILVRVNFLLSDLIDETLSTRDISLEKLALQTGINVRVFHAVMDGKGLPRLHIFLKMLIELDANVVDFFKRAETGLDLVPVTSEVSIFKEGTDELISQIDHQLEDILKGIRGERGSDVEKFKSRIYFGLYRSRRNKEKASNSRKLTLEKILQTARMLGIKPSDVLQYSENLKSHARLEGIESRTLLSSQAIEELLEHVHKSLKNMIEESGMGIKELAAAMKISEYFLKKEVVGQRGRNLHYSTLEKVLEVLNSDVIRFFEELEWSGKFDVHAPALASLKEVKEGLVDQGERPMGVRISQIREMLLPFFPAYKLDEAMARNVDGIGTNLTQRDVHFKTLYKASRVANISLSDVVSDRPVETLFDASQYSRHLKIEKIPAEEVKRAEQFLAYLLFNEFRRQHDENNLALDEFAARSRLFINHINSAFSGARLKYSVLRQIVERGLNTPLPLFLEGFEAKLQSFEHIPRVTRKMLSELKGLSNPKAIAKAERVRERIDQMIKFFHLLKVESKSLEEAMVFRFRNYKNFKEKNASDIKIYTVIRFCHFLGINFRDFFGQKSFTELVKGKKQFNFERLPDEKILQIVGKIKHNVDKRREELNLSVSDLEILLGAKERGYFENFLLNESVRFFPWHRYFQLAEILAREGEDDFFLLDGIEL